MCGKTKDHKDIKTFKTNLLFFKGCAIKIKGPTNKKFCRVYWEMGDANALFMGLQSDLSVLEISLKNSQNAQK